MEWLDESRWADIHTFRYRGLRFDPSTGVAEFDYLHDGSAQQLRFTDTIEFPLPCGDVDPAALESFGRVLELLYVAVGTVYYKGVAPGRVSVDAVPLAPAATRWAEALYQRGLAEFAHRWTLEHVLDLPVETEHRSPVGEFRELATAGRIPLVAIGGGKDSIVALEILHTAGFAPAMFAVEREPTPLLEEIMARGPGPGLLIRRQQDPEMTRLLRENAMRVGHVPVTAINALAGAAAGALHGLGPVVLANERSADESTMVWRGREVNHQWAKGSEAESLLDAALREHAGLGTGCFSLLRGLSELAICRLFAATRDYDALLTSCNFAFRMSHQGRTQRWCNDCAKCRFVFLALASSMEKRRLLEIFAHDLLDDPSQLDGYRELAGLAGHKPFECVGEIAETRAAAAMLAEDPRWRRARVVRELAAQLPPMPAATADGVWQVDKAPAAPEAYQHAVDQWVPVAPPLPHGGS
ncbi:hypothetical protein LQ327_01335 [Actinomycetospora endophytica]|uniref:UDP-N-acetyl-alpha-D-muramoyl-L-alanyl-L-glutamate epimerase n=1 Tax=Actinomycetospora endophytica TaxID=2291215 RepID=A0ABS8P1B5_9PSEU|nr:hypothetical protein [Actinomycetospora endophytica]MCD2192033.1 hypothetical protein [Actinomycetospora endophytica]